MYLGNRPARRGPAQFAAILANPEPETEVENELDASIMHGPTREAGAVTALPGFESPIQIARGVMGKTPHVLLAGSGAKAFARDQNYAEVSDASNYYKIPVGVTKDEIASNNTHGTVGAGAADQSGALVAATSTGGTFGKLKGRVGDTPLIGLGTWADDDIAISCRNRRTHHPRRRGYFYRLRVDLRQILTRYLH